MSDGELLGETTVRFLRLLFLAFAEARGLYARGRRLRIFGLHSGRAPCRMDLSELNLEEALQHLACDGVPRRKGRGALGSEPVDIRVLGDVYEAILEHTKDEASRPEWNLSARTHGWGMRSRAGRRVSARKRAGIYYTPENVVSYMVRKALGRTIRGLSSEEILRVRVVDPAMGSGHFLLKAADYLAGAYRRALAREAACGNREARSDSARYRSTIIERCIYGVDTDPIAVEVSRASLWLLAGGGPKTMQALRRHLRCGDALSGSAFHRSDSWQGIGPAKRSGRTYGTGRLNRPRPFNWGVEFPEAALGARSDGGPGFDVVVGNPPYVSFSGRQKAGGAAEAIGRGGRRARLRGWPSGHGLFILRAIELLRRRGVLSFITPGQVGHLKGYGPVRTAVLDTCDLLEVRYWGEDVFKGATTPALTFVARRREGRHHKACVLKRNDGGTDTFSPEGDGPWFVSPHRHLLERMADLHPTIETFGDPGVHTGNVADKILAPARKAGWVPIVEGRQIGAFRCDPPATWINLEYKPSPDEYFRASNPGVYQDADILIRQTASRPVAARHSHRCHFRNSVLALRAPDGFSIEYLLGVLNSDAANVLYRALAPESGQRSFPQIKIHALRHLPIPDPGLDRNKPVAARIERLVTAIETRIESGKPVGRRVRSLNTLIWRLYGVPDRPA